MDGRDLTRTFRHLLFDNVISSRRAFLSLSDRITTISKPKARMFQFSVWYTVLISLGSSELTITAETSLPGPFSGGRIICTALYHFSTHKTWVKDPLVTFDYVSGRRTQSFGVPETYLLSPKSEAPLVKCCTFQQISEWCQHFLQRWVVSLFLQRKNTVFFGNTIFPSSWGNHYNIYPTPTFFLTNSFPLSSSSLVLFAMFTFHLFLLYRY